MPISKRCGESPPGSGADVVAKIDADTKIDRALTEFAERLGADDPVAVVGGRTKWEVGGAPADGTRMVAAPTGIVSYLPSEMVAVVRAGTTITELQSALADAGQRSALPYWGNGSTVGGALAVGQNSLDVLGRGRLRASLLQVRYVSADGHIITGGGPTVKNVTGFDLPRLMVGSLGTLGSLAEVILRTNPIPDTMRWLRGQGIDPFAAFDALFRPSAVLWDGKTTWIKIEGHRVDVDAEQAALVRRVGPVEEVDGPPELPAHRWSLAPRELRHLDQPITDRPKTSNPTYPVGRYVASIGVGTVWASEPQPARSVSDAIRTVAARMKAEFDPTGRLNPGRDPYTTAGM